MCKKKKLQLFDIIVFVLVIMIAVITFSNNKFSVVLDNIFLPERRNKGYYELLNSPSQLSESRKLYENGTKNLLANYLWSGDREAGYKIIVNADGSFRFSGNYLGENDTYERIVPIEVGLELPSGEYILSDGGASSEDNIYVKIVGAKQMFDGTADYITASLPDNPLLHWDGDSDRILYCELVICPGASANNLIFSPMLLRIDEVVDQKYQPCITPNYDWENYKEEEEVKVKKYYIDKNTMDGETVTQDDWKIFLNSLRFQMQAERAVIDLKDGYGIDIQKKEYPQATYGKLNVSLTVSEGQEINIMDYDEVIRVINSHS